MFCEEWFLFYLALRQLWHLSPFTDPGGSQADLQWECRQDCWQHPTFEKLNDAP